MSEFQREHRYWVIKRKHLHAAQDELCRQLCGRLHYEGVPEVEAVVVESDWPIYDETWENVQRLAEGKPSIRYELVRVKEKADMYLSLLDEFQHAKNLPDEEIRPYLQELYAKVSPKDALARRDLLKQAETLDEAADDAEPNSVTAGWLRERAEMRRQQAEGEGS